MGGELLKNSVESIREETPADPDGYFQAISFAGRVPAGTVAYHAAFGIRAS